MMNYKISLMEVIKKIRNKFGDDKIYLTLVAFQSKGKAYSAGTFASDNIEVLEGWTAVYQAKLISGSIKAVSIVLRIFFPEKYEVEIKGKKVKIPEKDIYNFLCTRAGCEGFTKEETFDNQTLDSENLENIFAPEPGLYYKSSEKILEEFMEEIEKEGDNQ